MIVQIGFSMTFVATAPTPTIMLLYVHPEVAANLLLPEYIGIETDSLEAVEIDGYLDAFQNRSARIVAPQGRITLKYDNKIRLSDEPEPVALDAWQHNVEYLPYDVLQYLLPSRYCEVDLLADEAWRLFGETPPGWPRVQAVCDWVFNHIEFGYHHASATMTAGDVFANARGVCRDFTHLAVTFCRCLNIPARYATGYLGEIRIAPTASAMDFSAFFEVYLGGAWHAFDSRNNARRFGRVLMARGRDAADTALTTCFNPMILENFEVWTYELERQRYTADE